MRRRKASLKRETTVKLKKVLARRAKGLGFSGKYGATGTGGQAGGGKKHDYSSVKLARGGLRGLAWNSVWTQGGEEKKPKKGMPLARPTELAQEEGSRELKL